MMTFPTEWKVIEFMFQATNQVLECSDIVCYPYNIMLVMWWSYVIISVPINYNVVIQGNYNASYYIMNHEIVI